MNNSQNTPLDPQPNLDVKYVKGIKIVPLTTQQLTKQQRRAKRSVKQWAHDRRQKHLAKIGTSRLSKFGRYVTSSLNQPKKLRTEWILIGVLSGVLIAFFGALLGIMQRFIGLSAPAYPAVANAQSLNEAMRIMCIIGIAIFAIPYFYMAAAFFSGINQIHKSKTVHIIIWFVMILNMVLMVVCACLLIAGYYGLDGYNLVHNLH